MPTAFVREQWEDGVWEPVTAPIECVRDLSDADFVPLTQETRDTDDKAQGSWKATGICKLLSATSSPLSGSPLQNG